MNRLKKTGLLIGVVTATITSSEAVPFRFSSDSTPLKKNFVHYELGVRYGLMVNSFSYERLIKTDFQAHPFVGLAYEYYTSWGFHPYEPADLGMLRLGVLGGSGHHFGELAAEAGRTLFVGTKSKLTAYSFSVGYRYIGDFLLFRVGFSSMKGIYCGLGVAF